MEEQSEILIKHLTLNMAYILMISSYVGIDNSGDTTDFWGWRNSNVDNSPPSHWIPFQGVASGLPGKLSLSGWKFIDLKYVLVP